MLTLQGRFGGLFFTGFKYSYLFILILSENTNEHQLPKFFWYSFNIFFYLLCRLYFFFQFLSQVLLNLQSFLVIKLLSSTPSRLHNSTAIVTEFTSDWHFWLPFHYVRIFLYSGFPKSVLLISSLYFIDPIYISKPRYNNRTKKHISMI